MNTRQFLLKLRLSTGYTILLVFLMWGQRVQAQTPPEVRPATRPLNEVLDAEGRLRPNLPAGSFDPKGFRMVQDANGAPRFLPESGGQDLGTRPFVTQSPTDDDANWDSRFENQDAVNGIYAFAQDAQGNLYVGGNFLRIGGVKANNIAKYSPSTNTWSSLGQGTNDTVWSLAVLGNDLYVGGYFTQAGGVSANSIAKYTPSTNTWAALGQGTNGGVEALAVLGSDLYVGGDFTEAGGVSANYIAKYSPSTNTWSSLGQGTNSTVESLAVLGSDLYVGGWFRQAGGVPANYIAKYSPSTNTWSSLYQYTNGVVYALAVLGSDLYVGGSFLSAGGKISPHLALWHTSTPAAPSLSSPSVGTTGLSLTPTLQWASVAAANTYRVEVATSSSFSTTVINEGNLGSTSYAIPAGKLSAGTTYYWRVRSVNVNGEGSPSSAYLFTTLAAPSAPSLTSPSNGAVNISLTPALAWGVVNTATGYDVEVFATACLGTPLRSSYDQAGTTYSPSGLSANTTYCWRVRAQNGNGEGGWTSASFTTAAAPSIALDKTSLTYNAVVGTNPANQTFTISNGGVAPLVTLAVPVPRAFVLPACTMPLLT